MAGPADRKHWTFADAGSGTDHVYLQAGYDNVAQTMAVEVNGVMYNWNAAGYLLATDVSGRKWTPTSFTFPSANFTKTLQHVQIPTRHYGTSALATKIQDELNHSGKTLSATYDVQYRSANGTIDFKLIGGASGEGARILTDDELSAMAYHAPYWGLNGTTWQAPHYNMTGTWYSGESIGEPVLFAHRVDLSESSDLGDNRGCLRCQRNRN